MADSVIVVRVGWGQVVDTIRLFRSTLPDGAIFTTAQLLALEELGETRRKSIDMAMYRMVKSGELERVAYGVFREPSPYSNLPTLQEVTARKLESRGKTCFPVAHTLGQAVLMDPNGMGYPLPTDEGPVLTVATDGPSSFFRTAMGLVYIKHVPPRKLYLEREESTKRIGLFLRTVWGIGKTNVDWSQVSSALADSDFGREERRLIRKSRQWMPQWMYEVLCEDSSMVKTESRRIVVVHSGQPRPETAQPHSH